jgi:hypothetical protein
MLKGYDSDIAIVCPLSASWERIQASGPLLLQTNSDDGRKPVKNVQDYADKLLAVQTGIK